jgi:hypothetical protein
MYDLLKIFLFKNVWKTVTQIRKTAIGPESRQAAFGRAWA